MPLRHSHFLALGGLLLLLTSGVWAQEANKASPPVDFPKLEKYAALWQRSIFTTKDLPSPDAPTGPNFADNLSLSGIYEIDGAVAAILVDRITSQVMEVRIGSENEQGIKIRKVTPGETVDKTRIQLQKGDQAGWVSFSDASGSQPAEVVQRAVIPTQQPPLPGSGPASMPNAVPPQQPRRISPSAAPVIPAVNPILPPPPAAARVNPINDVPLPPP